MSITLLSGMLNQFFFLFIRNNTFTPQWREPIRLRVALHELANCHLFITCRQAGLAHFMRSFIYLF